ncbi:MAG: substrate-binding periplasmic protein [Oligoflexales bacterium]
MTRIIRSFSMLAITLSFLLFGIVDAISYGKPKLVIAAEYEEFYVTKDGSGAYIDLLKALLGEKYDLKFKYWPWARAEKMFLKGKVDAIIGQTPESLAQRMDRNLFIHPTGPMDVGYLQAFYLKGKYEKWDDEILKTARLLWKNEYGYDQLIKHKVNFKNIEDFSSALNLLKKDRADVLLSYEEVVLPVVKKQFSKKDFDFAFTKIFEEYHLILKNNKNNERVIKLWDEKFSVLISNGEITNIFAKNGVEYSTYVKDPLADLNSKNLVRGVNTGTLVSGFYQQGKTKMLVKISKDNIFDSVYEYEYEGDMLVGMIKGGTYDPSKGIAIGQWCEGKGKEEYGTGQYFFEYNKKGKIFMTNLYSYGEDTTEWHNDHWKLTKPEIIPKDFEKMVLKKLKDCPRN